MSEELLDYEGIIKWECDKFKYIHPAHLEDMAQECRIRLLVLQRSGKLKHTGSITYVRTCVRGIIADYIRYHTNAFKMPVKGPVDYVPTESIYELVSGDGDQTYLDTTTEENALWEQASEPDHSPDEFAPGLQVYVERLLPYEQRALRARYLGSGERPSKIGLNRAHKKLRAMMTEPA